MRHQELLHTEPLCRVQVKYIKEFYSFTKKETEILFIYMNNLIYICVQ